MSTVTPRRCLPLAVLAAALLTAGCGSGTSGAAGSHPAVTAPTASPGAPPAAHRHRSGPAQHRAGSTTPGTGVSGRVAPAGSYDDTSGTKIRRPRTQGVVLTHLPGSTGSRCVSVGDRHDVRSGMLAMGDFATARAAYAASNGAYDAEPTHLYVIPRSRTTRSVALTLTRVGGGAPPIRVGSHQAADAAQWRFFPVSLAITRPGTWRVAASAGAAHGCFLVTFRR